MSIKIEDFEFQTGEEPQADGALRVVFRVEPQADPVAFLTELSRFVGRLVSDAAASRAPVDLESVSMTQAEEEAVVAALDKHAEQPAPAQPKRTRAPRGSSKPPAEQAPAQTAELPKPEVTTHVVPPRVEAQPTAASVRAAHPTLPVESAQAVVELGQQLAKEAIQRVAEPPKAPTNGSATTGPGGAPSAAAPAASTPPPAAVDAIPLDQVPADLLALKSFRQWLVALNKAGANTPERMIATLHRYANVPCIKPYLAPQPTPDAALDMRVQRAFEAGILVGAAPAA